MEETLSDSLTVMPIERKDGTYALRLCLNQGLMTPDMTKRVLGVMETYPGTTLRATTGQRMNLEGVPKDKLDAVVALLGTQVPMCPPGVAVCPGSELCKYGQQETRDIGNRLLELIKANAPYPFKIKSGVSGCGMGCGLSFVRDIGLVARAKGWAVYFGGSGRHRAAPGIQLSKAATTDEALELVQKGLDFYKENGRKGERIGMMVRRLGRETVEQALL